MTKLARQAIAETLAARPGLTIARVDPACLALVSCVPDTEAARAAVGAVVGFALPTEPNRMAGDLTRALAIAPGQWLILSDDPNADALATRLAASCFASDIRDGMAVFELAGPHARDILAMGCALDFDSAAMAPGRCARTAFAGIAIIIHAVGSRERWRLHLDRAFARHLAEWLKQAATAI